MNRRIRPWGLALVGSLLLHAGLFGGLRWQLPQWDSPPEPPSLAVELVAAPPPPPAVKPPAPVPSPAQASPPRALPPDPVIKPVPLAKPAGEPVPAAIPVAEVASEPVAEAVLADVTNDPPADVADRAAVEPVPPPLNPLPPRLDLRYRLRYGLASGEQTLVWVNQGERYTLSSVAVATGLAGVFYRGQFAQISRGRITSGGLQPEDFWDQRGDKRSRASFDAAQGLIVLEPDSGAPRRFSYQGTVQDALSLFFQFALTAPPSGRQLEYRVFNGKKLRDYRYDVLGEAVLDTRLGVLRTLHLVRSGSGDGRFEIWLAIDRHYLPVRIRRSDESDSDMELSIQSITP
ncbi:MAG: hypothetical protein B7Z03_12180 [Hydrogenophilales bacterium 32-62-9]|nr:MAG: hypothetical protein B7Z03_12180 [Hydrogenophilales bacterium 32-62-9]